MNCISCIFYYEETCRRYPPSRFTMPYGDVYGKFPLVAPGYFCGEFRREAQEIIERKIEEFEITSTPGE